MTKQRKQDNKTLMNDKRSVRFKATRNLSVLYENTSSSTLRKRLLKKCLIVVILSLIFLVLLSGGYSGRMDTFINDG